MKAAVFHGREDVRVEEVPEPAPPASGELLVDVSFGALCGTDAAEYAHGPVLIPLAARHGGSGHVGPLVLGHEFTGRIAAAGDDVDGFQAGQRIVSGAGVSCGSCAWCRAGRTNLCERYYTLGLQADGGLAERVLVPASTCELVPEGCGDEAASLAQPLAVALHAVDRARVDAGDSVAVIGVGGIGAFVVAAAHVRGASPLVAVDIDERRLEAARRVGADETLDAADAPGDRQLDVVIEASGTASGLETAVRMVRRGGRILLVGLHDEPRAMDLLDLSLREVEVLTTVAHVCGRDLPAALQILASTELAQQVIDPVIPLDEVVESGLVPLAEHRATGKIVVRIGGGA
ncbi:MAG: (R,R)-butanediol dehydrogenase / meso-butanediol dehydrogenase / diacetyl reductase [Gaiellaceae bacterium]|nr:(R,R)-butanediol dehydrogenase / meso-butanediol dehydrogenase / diacetyl reductase [Gaiellaceae bacterium]